jgi:hypothetical protein
VLPARKEAQPLAVRRQLSAIGARASVCPRCSAIRYTPRAEGPEKYVETHNLLL